MIKEVLVAMERCRRHLVFGTCLIESKEAKMLEVGVMLKKSLHEAEGDYFPPISVVQSFAVTH